MSTQDPAPVHAPARHGRRLRLRAVRLSNRGTAAMEFALVAAPFFALIMAVFQISLTYFVQQALETAAEKSIRRLLTGEAQKGNLTKAQFKSLVCSNLPAFMTCSNIMVDVQVATSFSSADTAAPIITYDASGNPKDTGVYSPGNGGDITVAKVMYVWNVQMGPLGFDISNMSGQRRLLVATSVLKTELFTS